MHNRSECKVCGGSGKIKAAKNTKYSVFSGKTGVKKGITFGHFGRIRNGQSTPCPFCRPDKYVSHVGKKQLARAKK
jgi:RecJ-like exonuclease